MKILFTGGGGAGNAGIFHLWNDKYDLHFADADPEAISPLFPQRCRHKIPFAEDISFLPEIASLCSDLNIDILVPGVDEELSQMGLLENRVAGLKILVPDPDFVDVMLDKLKTAQKLEEKGVGGPKTLSAAESGKISFPCFVKPRRGRGSRGAMVLNSEQDLIAYIRLSEISAQDIVVQDLLVGQEYTVMMAADASANLHAVVPVQVDVKRGVTIRAKTNFEPSVIAMCRKIHRAIPARGCYNIQLMFTPAGEVMPFEINPRISTTFCLGVASGINPVAIFLHDLEPPSDILPFANGVTLKRTWQNHFSTENG